MASTVRWLSTATPDELTNRLGTTADMSPLEAVAVKAANGSSPSSSPVIITESREVEASGTVGSDSPILQDTSPPPILSFSQFVNRRKTNGNQSSTSKRQSSDGGSQGMEKKSKC